jgi:hypothetical protein
MSGILIGILIMLFLIIAFLAYGYYYSKKIGIKLPTNNVNKENNISKDLGDSK